MLLDLLGSSFSETSHKNFQQHYKTALKFFLVVFDFRLQHPSSPQSEIEIVEKECISSFLLLVLRLNEALFKPMFLKIVDWAIDQSNPEINNNNNNNNDNNNNNNNTNENHKASRSIMFYKLMEGLTNQLKSIFVPYFGYILDDVVKFLSVPIPENDDVHYKRACLMLSSLTRCFSFDTDRWINKDKFDRLLGPLVSVLDNHSISHYEELVQSYLSPSLAQLALSVSTEVCFFI
jgi:U3 small nucleolar RNA-associated protein 10